MRPKKDQGDAGDSEKWEALAVIGGLLLSIILPIALVVLSAEDTVFKEAQLRHPDFAEDIVVGILLFSITLYFMMMHLRAAILKTNKRLFEAMDMRNELSRECNELCDLFRRANGVHKLRNHTLADIISGKLNEFCVPTCDERQRLKLLTDVVSHSTRYVYAYTYARETYLERFFLEFKLEVDAYLEAHRKAKSRDVDVKRLLVVPDDVLKDKSTKAFSYLEEVVNLHTKHRIFVGELLWIVSETDVFKEIDRRSDRDYVRRRLKNSFFLCDDSVFSHGEKDVSFIELSPTEEEERAQSSGNINFYHLNNGGNTDRFSKQKNMFDVLYVQAQKAPFPPIIRDVRSERQGGRKNSNPPNGNVTKESLARPSVKS